MLETGKRRVHGLSHSPDKTWHLPLLPEHLEMICNGGGPLCYLALLPGEGHHVWKHHSEASEQGVNALEEDVTAESAITTCLHLESGD